MLLALVVLPRTAERYYGPAPDLAAALAAGANTWKLAHREAAANRPVLRLPDHTEARGWPLAVPAGAGPETAFTLHGGLGWIPVRLTGLDRPEGVELWRVTRAGREQVVQGDPVRAYWQTDYDDADARWTLTYNLPATATPAHYVALRRVPEPAILPPPHAGVAPPSSGPARPR
jgi:hypothetical protein